MKFRFMEEHREEFPVKRMGKVLGVSRSGYYSWRMRAPSAREMANQALWEEITAAYDRNLGTYGSPRVYRELKEQGVKCSENRIARLMGMRGLRARQTKRYRTTTKRNSAVRAAPNLVKGDFRADRPDQIWLADITYIPTEEGWLYLAAIEDLYTRGIVGWTMSDRMTANLTLGALKMALAGRQPEGGVIHHSDQGSQYTNRAYQALLEAHGLQASMNSVGSWYDNAPMESFFGTLKSEWIYHNVYATRAQAKADVFYYIEAFYNRQRRHSALDYTCPAAYEQLFYEQDCTRA